jgi:Trk K+ transport system NAD-binding subunit
MKTMATQLALLLSTGQRRSNTRLLFRFILLLLALIVVYSVLFHLLMGREGREYSWVTGLYWTLTTMSTLGFGDITFAGDAGRLFSVVVLVSGIIFLLIILPFTFIQFFYAPWLEEHNKARVPRAVAENLSGHVILTHFDNLVVNLIEKLGQYGIAHVVVTPDFQGALALYDQGYQVVVGELDNPTTYGRLRIDQAALVLVMNDDMVATNVISTIRETNERVTIVTSADLDDSLDILQLAGSTHVFQFTKMLGRSLARRVLGVSMQANVIGRFDQLLIAEAPAMRTWLQGKTLAESRLRQTTGVNVVGIWEQGQFLLPSPRTPIGEATVLVLAGTERQLEGFDRSIMAAREGPSGPVLVLGWGRVGQAVVDILRARQIDFRVVEKKAGITAQDSRYIQGSAADLEILEKAGIRQTPSIIITTHDDNLNIYLTIYCRRLRPDAQIISRASLDRNINTLHRAGANLVMSFSSLVTATIMNLLQPQQMLMLSEGLNAFRVGLNPKLENKALRDLQVRESTGCSIVAIKRKDEVMVNPDPDIVLVRDDELVLIGTADAEKLFNEKYPTAP